MSTFHFVILPFCQIATLSMCHFVNLPFYQLAILSSFHFVNLPFCQITILLTWHSVLFTKYPKKTQTYLYLFFISFWRFSCKTIDWNMSWWIIKSWIQKRWFSSLYRSTIYSSVLKYTEYNTQIGNIFFRW
jgi:hypothetical protein